MTVAYLLIQREEVAQQATRRPSRADDDAARQGITAATSAAQHLPGALGADLLDATRTAFTAGLTTARTTVLMRGREFMIDQRRPSCRWANDT
jgi:hypothetical protein